MKKFQSFLFAVAFYAFTSCAPAADHQLGQIDTASSRANIDLILTKWHEDAAQAKMAYFDAMTVNGIYIGTDASELWTTKEFKEWSKKYFEEGNTWDFKAEERNIYFSENGKVAWFDELLSTWMGTCRGSGVLEYQNNQWKIAHYHLSVTIPNEKIQEVIELKSSASSDSLNVFESDTVDTL